MEEHLKLAVVTVWYNEARLAPLFLKHYDYADSIFIILDTDTTDNSKDIAGSNPKVILDEITFPDKMDDEIRIEKIHDVVRGLTNKFDWVIVVDADQFVFAPGKYFNNPKEFLREQEDLGFDTVQAKIHMVYKHKTEKDINYSQPPLLQRRHGIEARNIDYYEGYINDTVVKPRRDIGWAITFHTLASPHKRTQEQFIGTHWAMADIDLAIERRIKNGRDRQSKNNLAKKLGQQHHKITEEKIKRVCEEHENDPEILSKYL